MGEILIDVLGLRGATVLFVLCCLGYVMVESGTQITTDVAVVRFQELAETPNVVVVRESNNAVFTGSPHDVTYELRVDGKPVTGRCQNGWFSPMVCRLYES